MKDGCGRTIDYLRISVTDKCNLRCQYCMPKEGIELLEHKELLTLEELFRVVTIMEQLGITKIRLTGGEPLVRRNLVKLISDINTLDGIEDIAMTTNGVLFADKAKELKEAGLRRVNISLDTLNQITFEEITRKDEYNNVIEAIRQAKANKINVKINCVPCKEFNEADIPAMAGLAKDYNIDVRFIELMPLGCGRKFTGISSDEILNILENSYGKAILSGEKSGNGPAIYYNFKGFGGKIGFISPMSHKFCSECNRIRLTADGMLKLCLHYDRHIDLKQLIRGGMSDEEIKEAIMLAIRQKPAAHNFAQTANVENNENEDTRKMVQIGG